MTRSKSDEPSSHEVATPKVIQHVAVLTAFVVALTTCVVSVNRLGIEVGNLLSGHAPLDDKKENVESIAESPAQGAVLSVPNNELPDFQSSETPDNLDNCRINIQGSENTIGEISCNKSTTTEENELKNIHIQQVDEYVNIPIQQAEPLLNLKETLPVEHMRPVLSPLESDDESISVRQENNQNYGYLNNLKLAKSAYDKYDLDTSARLYRLVIHEVNTGITNGTAPPFDSNSVIKGDHEFAKANYRLAAQNYHHAFTSTDF